MENEDDKVESQQMSFTINPRQILYDYNNGRITKAERTLLLWMRLQGNPYGFGSFNMKALAEDTFPKPVQPSYINRLLGALREKGYIYYKDRKGCRGSFQVDFDYWIVNKQLIRRFDGGLKKVVSTEGVNQAEDSPVDCNKILKEVRATKAEIPPEIDAEWPGE